jgi:hypothetical protein
MSISEELNAQQFALQYVDEKYNNAYTYDKSVDNVKLHSCIPPFFNFYQWNDFGESLI